MVATLLERFNSGKVSAMMSLYAPEAVFIAKDGTTITDHTEIAAQLERDLKLGLPLEAKARHVFVADDIAQIVLDWSIDGTGPDGKSGAPRRLGKRYPARRRGWTLAVPDRQ
jgi:ketosteroid isomerase-like protein